MQKLKAPGMRTIKTALVVAIVLFASMLLDLKFPYYAAIAAIICTQNTIHGSFKVSKDRILGTLVGSVMGVVFVYIFSYNPWTSGVGVLILLYILDVIKLQDAFRVSCIVYLATFVPGHGPAIEYGIDRSLATIIGILIALAVNLLVSPPKYSNDIRKYSNQLVDELFKICGDFFMYGKPIDLSTAGSNLIKVESLINNYKLDENKVKSKMIDTELLDVMIIDTKKVYNHLGIIKELTKNESELTLNQQNIRFVSEIYEHDMIYKEYKEAFCNQVFNYHVDELKKYLVSFKNIDRL